MEKDIGWDDGICFFCKIRPAVAWCSHSVEMHKIVSRNKRFVILGTKYSQSFEVMAINVPRCKRCRSLHESFDFCCLISVPLLGGIVTAILVGGVNLKFGNLKITEILGFCISVIFWGAITSGILAKLIEWFWRASTKEAQHYPAVREQRRRRWKIGSSPTYKW